MLDRYPGAVFNDTGRPLAGDALVAFLRGHDRAITGLEVLDAALFGLVPELRLVSKYGVGLDTIDLDAARAHHVEVRWTPGVNRQSVAELTLAFMIALRRHLVPLVLDVRRGGWPHFRDGHQLSSATVGIIGCGHVGQTVARLCRAFGATVVAHDIRAYAEFYREHDIAPLALDDLLRAADIVTLHVPLDASTRGLMGADQIARMKPSAAIINTSRGGVVDEGALHTALAEGRLAGAALDVFVSEPPGESPLLSLPNVLATPHVGGGTREAVLLMGRAAIAGLEPGPETPRP